MLHLGNFIAHTRAVFECLPRFEATATIDTDTCKLIVRARGRQLELIPQFISTRENRLSFTPTLVADSHMFLGWRPYLNRVWPLAADKLMFKVFCQANGLLSPRRFESAAQVDADVLIKRVHGSLGQGVSAPLQAERVAATHAQVVSGEYFEQFIRGETAKIWYVNEKPVCLEIMPMPTVIGDGIRTLRQLIESMRSMGRPDWQMCEGLALYQDTSLDAIVPADRQVIVEIRYLSSLHSLTLDSLNVMSQHLGTPLAAALEQAGPVFHGGIPEPLRRNVLYTVDAIIDSQGRPWFLEMNCNSVVHPDSYGAIFADLLGAPGSGRVDWGQYAASFGIGNAAASAVGIKA